ncbi:MAG TPA: cupin domain-containing protein [Flavitalea sp.]|nr:cupin domain-containing protein [Flavitalea sp.]
MEHFISFGKMALREVMTGTFAGSLESENLTIAYTDMKAGVEVPLHHHPEEAVDIIMEGELEMQVGEAVNLLTHGMISIVPSNMPHRAKAISNCKVITILHPRRSDLKQTMLISSE